MALMTAIIPKQYMGISSLKMKKQFALFATLAQCICLNAATITLLGVQYKQETSSLGNVLKFLFNS
jgi:hypothetical protein